MSHNHDTDKTGQIITIAAVAALVGAATAMLLTPRTGEQNRNDLKQRATDVARKAKARFSDDQEELEEIIEAVRERLQQTADSAAAESKKVATKARQTTRTAATKAPKPRTPRSSTK